MAQMPCAVVSDLPTNLMQIYMGVSHGAVHLNIINGVNYTRIRNRSYTSIWLNHLPPLDRLILYCLLVSTLRVKLAVVFGRFRRECYTGIGESIYFKPQATLQH